MSSVWETRNRLVLEYIERLADQLRSKEPIAPPALEEQTVRWQIQTVEACDSTSSVNTSEGFFQFSILRGLSFISLATIAK